MVHIAPLDDTQNRLVRTFRHLRRPHHRPAYRCLVEGVRLVSELLQSGVRPYAALYSPHLVGSTAGRDLVAQLGKGSTKVLYVTDALLASVAETETPQGVVAAVDLLPVTMEDACLSPKALVVVAQGVQDPGNLGSMIRTADAAGASGVLLAAGTVDAANSKVLRASMGSLWHLPVADVRERDWLADLRQWQIQIVMAAVGGQQLPYAIDFKRPTALVLGSEAHGLAPELLEQADATVKIPMPGRAESLNVASAAAVLLFEAVRQRQFK